MLSFPARFAVNLSTSFCKACAGRIEMLLVLTQQLTGHYPWNAQIVNWLCQPGYWANCNVFSNRRACWMLIKISGLHTFY